MKKNILLLLGFILIVGQAEVIGQSEKPRVIVMTDGEIVDNSSMIRFLLFTNDVELLAIIETNPRFKKLFKTY